MEAIKSMLRGDLCIGLEGTHAFTLEKKSWKTMAEKASLSQQHSLLLNLLKE